MSMSKLLIDDYPIQVLPKLAEEVGLNEAILLQQLHYWLNNKSAKFIDGKKWIYNTYKDWEKQFPFWSNATIRRTINSCEKQNMILSANYNKLGFDKTKWYTINYEEVERVSKRVAQNEQRSCSKRASGVTQNEQTNTIDYTETTSETTKESPAKAERIPYKKIIDYLNEQADRSYSYKAKMNRTLIRARWNGRKAIDKNLSDEELLEQFKSVIDKKVADANDTNHFFKSEYLRPSTLFAESNFDKYLNQPERSEQKSENELDDIFAGMEA